MIKLFSKNKLLFIYSLIFIFNFSNIFASPKDSVKEYTLENGMKVFLLEDTTTPLLRIEFTTRAGFSSQTQKTSGFFKLYTNLFEKSLPQIKFDSCYCNADSSRYIVTVTSSQKEKILDAISKTAFEPNFSNELIQSELTKLKQEVKENAQSMSGFINSAIDSKVFSDSPWKHDSGIYPSLFNKTTVKNARSILNTISLRYYTPQNSAIFISGNFNSKQILNTLNNTFGRFYNTYSAVIEKKESPKIKQRKFVLHDPEFSDELTQVVIQYTNLDMQESDLAALVYNNNYSFFKYNLLNIEELNIPGDEYINASSAHKRNNNRLIIQTLLQKPENPKIKTNSLKQSLLFEKHVKESMSLINSAEFENAQQNAAYSLNLINSSSSEYMNSLSEYWAIEPYQSFYEDCLDNAESSIAVQTLASRYEKYRNTTAEQISNKLKTEEPFVFVIINTNDFNANKKEYLAKGFEEITIKNASWYTQKEFAEIKNYNPDDDKNLFATESFETENDSQKYYIANKEQIKKVKLQNGIPLVTKYNNNTTQATFLISICGGKLNTVKNHGFEEVMINILATNIQREIVALEQKGQIVGMPELTWQSDITTSSIIIECENVDLPQIAKAVANAIIYSDVLPATADRAVSNRQYKKRMENGSAVNQMYAKAVSTLYPDSDFINIFETEKDVLEDTNYLKILEYYPVLLDSSRYKLIVTGNFSDNIVDVMNSTLGLLTNNKGKTNLIYAVSKLDKSKTVTLKINHTFLTDIPAEKAGPMPAVLIPTTQFLDPVMYFFSSPTAGTKEEALFNAMLLYIVNKLQNQINENSRLKNSNASVMFAKAQMDTAAIVVQNVPHTKELDAAYKNIITEIKKELSSQKAGNTITLIKDIWTSTQLQDAGTNTGTAKLMQQGFEYFPYESNTLYYLDMYNFIQTAQIEDFLNILSYFPELPVFKIYSKDGIK